MLGTSADAASAAQLPARCSLLVFLERRLPHALRATCAADGCLEAVRAAGATIQRFLPGQTH